jgi:hypothetical protein
MMNINESISNITLLLTQLNLKVDNVILRLESVENSIKHNSISNISEKKIVKQNINLCILEKGFNLDQEFILECLDNKSIIRDIELFKAFYIRDNTNLPFQRNGKNISYFNEEWCQNNDNYIEHTIIFNIINTYIESMRIDRDDILDSEYKSNLNYIIKLQTNKQYKNSLLKSILDLI